MKRKSFHWLLLTLICVFSYSFQAFATTSDYATTKIDWWLVRGKDHCTPRVNQTHKFDYATYDTHYVGDTSRKVIYLTFDEGYEKGYTPAILDTLKKNDVKAIFFVTSPYVEGNPDLIKRMVEEGHLVANHSKNHPSMPKYVHDPARFTHEIQDVADKYTSVTGEDMPKLFRPPMGHYCEKSLAMTKELGYKTVFWSFAYADFDVSRQPSHAYAKKIILDNLHNGCIMLLHAVSRTNAEVLDEVIQAAKNEGYTFELFN